MSENLCRFVVCASDLKNELLMTKISLNVTNVFMFRMMQSLKKKSLKSIMMIHYQDTLRLKRF